MLTPVPVSFRFGHLCSVLYNEVAFFPLATCCLYGQSLTHELVHTSGMSVSGGAKFLP